jgi:hypothetical protein
MEGPAQVGFVDGFLALYSHGFGYPESAGVDR